MKFFHFTITGAEVDEEKMREFADSFFFQEMQNLLQARMKDRTEDLVNAPAAQHDVILARLNELKDLSYQLDSYAPDSD